MSNFAKLVGSVLKDAAVLDNKTVAATVAAAVVPVIADLFGAHLSVQAVAGWIVLVGIVAAALDKQTAAKAAAPAAPPPSPAAPAKK